MQDILLLVGMKARTGELVLESGNNIGTIIFHNGTILQAFSPYSRAIGDLLVEDGLITESELIEMLREQMKNRVFPIGDLFRKAGKVSFEDIETRVHRQIREAIREFASWQKPRVSFADREIEPFDRIHLPVHEFIDTDTVNSAGHFCSMALGLRGTSSASTAA